MLSPLYRTLLHPFAEVPFREAEQPMHAGSGRSEPLPSSPVSPASHVSTLTLDPPHLAGGRSPFGQILKAYRKTHGLTQEQLAAVLCVEPRTLRCWENERPLNNLRELRRIAEILGIAPELVGVAAYPSALRFHYLLRGWSQEHLAKLLGVEPETISKWECGEQKPSLHDQERLCKLFDTTADKLGLL
jgi:transcriptional regulator with XRE-family HTH domain